MASTLFTSHAMLAAYADARLPGSIADRELCPKALRPRTPLPLAPRNHEKPHILHNLHSLLKLLIFCSLRAMEVLGLCRRILHHVHHVHRGKLLNLGDGSPIERQTIAGL